MWLAQWATQVQWLALWPCSELATCGQAVEVTCAASEINDLAMSISQIRGSIVVDISACHAEDPGSIPGRGVCSDAAAPRVAYALAILCKDPLTLLRSLLRCFCARSYGLRGLVDKPDWVTACA